MFLPTTRDEVKQRGWDQLDVILVSGDTYIDTSYNGIAIIGNLLQSKGYRVGVICQPDIKDGHDITRMGEPLLFWGISAGCVDSMVANYTATKKFRNNDDFTPGGENNRRPDRASMVYTNLIRQHFKQTKPIVLGGIEASLRRISHYDYWENKVRNPLLFDSKADILVYGMGERTILELADKISKNESWEEVRGICYLSKKQKPDFLELPSASEVKESKPAFQKMFQLFYQNTDFKGRGLFQECNGRFLIQNPAQPYETPEELDLYYNQLSYERDVHPYYKKQGKVKALETIQFSITTHRGCYGECNFCAIAVHQGRTVRSRAETSIISEAKKMTTHPQFKGNIADVGGPTANMYGVECLKKTAQGSCAHKRCLYPHACQNLPLSHERQSQLLKKLREIKGIKHVFIASGIRYDMIQQDASHGKAYLLDLIKYHISGQLKIAPEHVNNEVLSLMGKPSAQGLIQFKKLFDSATRQLGKKQFLTYYFIASHPGCQLKHMHELKKFVSQELKLNPEQIQIFTPTPSTYSTLAYYTETNPFSGDPLFVEKDVCKKELQKNVLF
ncbi:MAG: YgiQ family radical SAM protein [Verrucomicrobia bacterium GWC2_42_7]|nr:MAG: YgiQ family radical SAM protein [Verrucomicrobia bacterium GWC2_42_7]